MTTDSGNIPTEDAKELLESLLSQFSRLGVLKAMMVGLFRMYLKLCAKLLF